MAWYDGTFRCGHKGRVNVIGPAKNRQYWIDLKFSGLCPECEANRKGEEYASAFERAQASAARHGYPNILGSEKQVEWATRIREEIMAPAFARAERIEAKAKVNPTERSAADVQRINSTLKWIVNAHTDASFWIEHRAGLDFDEMWHEYEALKQKNMKK